MDADIKDANLYTKREKQKVKYARKLAFSLFVKSHGIFCSEAEDQTQWICCSSSFSVLKEFHRHVAVQHEDDIKSAADGILKEGCSEARRSSLKRKVNVDSDGEEDDVEKALPCAFTPFDVYPWLPPSPSSSETGTTSRDDGEGQILLFYKYRKIKNIIHVRNWQEILCKRLGLTGKIRIAAEGINATVGGTKDTTEKYVESMKQHPLFENMIDWEFKRSSGSDQDFPEGLKVGIYQEIVPMGISPTVLSHENTGKHLSVDEFHAAVKCYLESERNEENQKLFIDCRNFYESKIGNFNGALCPDIRKFSYWPEFVDKNKTMFENKDVYMYCTGGIRCERGSAYLLDKGMCKNVYQLHGGIHKYIEKYPEGYFRGKLFVFDDRFSIKANEDVISECRYCATPWDQYMPCSSRHCHQLVLSCDKCRLSGLTACCPTCQKQEHNTAADSKVHEECDCTKARQRVPTENT